MKHHSVAGDVKKKKKFYSNIVFNMKSIISVGGKGHGEQHLVQLQFDISMFNVIAWIILPLQRYVFLFFF